MKVIHLALSLGMVELHLESPICHHGMMLNSLSTENFTFTLVDYPFIESVMSNLTNYPHK
jgi:hypothetical protein